MEHFKLKSVESDCVDMSSDVLLTSFSKVRMMSTMSRITTSPTNAPRAAASKGNGNSGAEAPSEVDVTEAVPEATTPLEEYLILTSPDDVSRARSLYRHCALLRRLSVEYSWSLVPFRQKPKLPR